MLNEWPKEEWLNENDKPPIKVKPANGMCYSPIELGAIWEMLVEQEDIVRQRRTAIEMHAGMMKEDNDFHIGAIGDKEAIALIEQAVLKDWDDKNIITDEEWHKALISDDDGGES